MQNNNVETNITINTSPEKNMIKFLEDQLDGAKCKIWVMHSIFRDKRVAEMLTNAAEKGLEVKVLMDRLNIDIFNMLCSKGVEVKVYNPDPSGQAQKLHQKVILIDSDIVLCGSVNLFEHSLERDYENLLRISSKPVKNLFDREFKKLWNQLGSLQALKKEDEPKKKINKHPIKEITIKAINILLCISLIINLFLFLKIII